MGEFDEPDFQLYLKSTLWAVSVVKVVREIQFAYTLCQSMALLLQERQRFLSRQAKGAFIATQLNSTRRRVVDTFTA